MRLTAPVNDRGTTGSVVRIKRGAFDFCRAQLVCVASADGEGGDGPGYCDCAKPEFARGQTLADGDAYEEERGRETGAEA
jgi:hypothetical protein